MIATSFSCQSKQAEGNIIVEDNFDRFDTTMWLVEMEPLPQSQVTTAHGKLVLDTRGGVTVWLKRKLSGDVEISFKRRVLSAGGNNNRISDLNQFWCARDPRSENIFSRNGKFEEYDSLEMYYAGVGGNSNTTTRFRKYIGTGERRLIKEYADSIYLLKPDHDYSIRIRIQNGATQMYVDDKCYFSYQDPDPLTEGYFGFRSTASHQEIDSLIIRTIK